MAWKLQLFQDAQINFKLFCPEYLINLIWRPIRIRPTFSYIVFVPKTDTILLQHLANGLPLRRGSTQREALATRSVEQNLELIFSIVTPPILVPKWPYWWGLSNGLSFDQIWYYYDGANKDLVPKKTKNSQFLVWWNLILNV